MGPRFNITTKGLTLKEMSDGRKVLSCTASSSIEDLHGDTITAECVQDMAGQAKASGMLIFLNHQYDVPEDVFGDTVDASALSRSQDGDGTAIWDMDLDINPADSNPRATKTLELIINDRKKLGISIGAQIEEWEFKDKDAGWMGGLIIKKVKLLEASIVGIPANQRSWVRNAVAAIKRSYQANATTDDDSDPISDAPVYRNGLVELPKEVMTGVEVKPGEVWELVTDVSGTSTHRQVTDPVELAKFWAASGTNSTSAGAITASGSVKISDIVKADMCSACGGSKGSPKDGCVSSYHKDAEPEITAESHPELPDSAFACIDAKGRHYPHHTASGGVDKNLLRNALARVADPGNTQCGKAHLKAHAKALGIGDKAAADDDFLTFLASWLEKDGDQTVTDDGFEADPEHYALEAEDSETELDVEASTESGTESPAQDSTELPATEAALDGNPSTEAHEHDEAVKDSAPLATALAEGLMQATKDLRDLTTRNSELTKENGSLKDDLRKAREHAAAADQLIEFIAKLPLGRKTTFAAPIEDFASTVKRIYGDEVAKHVE